MSEMLIELVYHWRDLSKRPRCIVFDLDHTLWSFCSDSLEYSAPISRTQTGFVDAHNAPLPVPTDVPRILHTFRSLSHEPNSELKLAVASRSRRGEFARECLRSFGWSDSFRSIQIYSCDKNVHMYAIRDELKPAVSFEEFLFFDDNKFNVRLANQMGIVSVLVDKTLGLDLKTVNYGLDLFEKS